MTILRTPAIRLSSLSAALLLVLGAPLAVAATPGTATDGAIPSNPFDLDAIIVTAAAPVSARRTNHGPIASAALPTNSAASGTKRIGASEALSSIRSV